LLDKTLILSNPQFHRKNLEDIINILIKNRYPLNLIFDTIKRIKLSRSGINVRFNKIFDTNKDNKQFFTIPYVKGVSEN